MDRLNATSTAPPPDWPLPSLPPSLVNVSKERKRHCRILSAKMVTFNLRQMAEAAYQEEHKKLDYKKVESTEHEFEKSVFEWKKMQKKNHLEKIKEKTAEEQKTAEPDSFDEMLERANALLSTLDSPPITTTNSQESSEISIPEPPPSPTASEPSARSPIIPVLSPSPASPTPKRLEASTPHPPPTLPPAHPLISTTALTSNPPSSSDLAFTRSLTREAHRNTKALTTTTPARPSPSQRLLPPPHPNTLAAFDAITQYGVAVATPATKKTNMTKLTFPEAVNKGFGEVMVMTAKASQKRRMKKEKKARAEEGEGEGEKKEKKKSGFRKAVGKGFREAFGRE